METRKNIGHNSRNRRYQDYTRGRHVFFSSRASWNFSTSRERPDDEMHLRAVRFTAALYLRRPRHK